MFKISRHGAKVFSAQLQKEICIFNRKKLISYIIVSTFFPLDRKNKIIKEKQTVSHLMSSHRTDQIMSSSIEIILGTYIIH